MFGHQVGQLFDWTVSISTYIFPLVYFLVLQESQNFTCFTHVVLFIGSNVSVYEKYAEHHSGFFYIIHPKHGHKIHPTTANL